MIWKLGALAALMIFKASSKKKPKKCPQTEKRDPCFLGVSLNTRQPCWKFVSTADALDSLSMSKPDFTHVNVPDADSVRHATGGIVNWNLEDQGSVVKVPTTRVLLMEGNIWNFSHARALASEARSRQVAFELPAARLYRLDKESIEDTEEWEREGELEYQMGMLRPWSNDDAGKFYVQLVDGNHRALAAMFLGDRDIFVTVAPNYREDVLDTEWVRR